ncbi:uncharacterized protein TRIVIDRAFT_216064 [Trichoderma virens Gv29-8]|uniref:Uncharacterized protein n=1 Tax=Hypocrea virens (strain Gv29-8 / FGSC 10586) TaxID=413071 RepID=G9MR50_HYPVG|nr:uncharacterized protein TRIVIDRAFT_216064 [Trichoderma virens Gv29-8]EHK22577.1 hypothetical protein TRIVIDRAFT_216064 [Trichoderma virens Gv29-8]
MLLHRKRAGLSYLLARLSIPCRAAWCVRLWRVIASRNKGVAEPGRGPEVDYLILGYCSMRIERENKALLTRTGMAGQPRFPSLFAAPVSKALPHLLSNNRTKSKH